ncbi:hypothetical protein POTG_02060 [Paenibacillus sp. oral taxon 786 str. D14]|nr:hypothetical protein POTG_02060 [Paenibacillus sp. oral taxon 786 str. D14]
MRTLIRPSHNHRRNQRLQARRRRIGRRLKYVKENDLAHGQWSRWCSESIGMDRKTADKFIVVFDELGGDDSTSSQIGISALYEIATLPPEERTREHTLKSGETKTPDEMTVRELREVKAALKEERERCERERQAREKAEMVRDTLESIGGQTPRVVKL